MVLVVNNPGVMRPSEAGKREPFREAQAGPLTGGAERVPEARFVAHLAEPLRPPDRRVFRAAFGNHDDERFAQGVLR